MNINRRAHHPGVRIAIATLLAAGLMQCAYAAPGDLIGSPITIGSSSSLFDGSPSTASDANGNLVATWVDGSTKAVVAQRFDANGNAMGSPLQIAAPSTTVLDWLTAPTVAVNASGQFVIVWTDNLPYYNTASARRAARPDNLIIFPDGPVGLHARSFNADGTSASGDVEFANLPFCSGPCVTASVAIDSSGDFVAGWIRASESPIIEVVEPQIFTQTADVYVRVYSIAGKPKTLPIKVDGGRATKPWFAKPLAGYLPETMAVGMDGPGNFTVAWYAEQFTSPLEFSNTVKMESFSAAGKSTSSVVAIHHDSNSEGLGVSIAMNPAGQYALGYTCSSAPGLTTLCAQTFQPGGVAVSGEFNVFADAFSATPYATSGANVAINASGNFMVGGLIDNCDSSGNCPQGPAVRLFAFNGMPTSSNVSFPFNDGEDPFVAPGAAIDPNGNAVTTYFGPADANFNLPVLLQRISGN